MEWHLVKENEFSWFVPMLKRQWFPDEEHSASDGDGAMGKSRCFGERIGKNEVAGMGEGYIMSPVSAVLLLLDLVCKGFH